MIASIQWCRNRMKFRWPEPSTPKLQHVMEVALQKGFRDPLCQSGEFLYVLAFGTVLFLRQRRGQYRFQMKKNTILLFLFYVGNGG